jgi:putative serine protease PepD
VERRLGEVELANDPAKVAAGVQPSVFTIATANELGSGFVVLKEAGSSLLLTNFHVVEESWFGSKTVGVFQEESKTVVGTIERINQSFDLALVRVPVELEPLPRSGETVEPGQPVLVVGSPFGLGGSVSSGSISALRSFNAVQFIQFSAPISPGNSGGPLVDATGQVVGVAVSKFIDFGAEGLGFAIPISQLCVQFQIC